jgi:hypothetical protein
MPTKKDAGYKMQDTGSIRFLHLASCIPHQVLLSESSDQRIELFAKLPGEPGAEL